MSILYNFFYTFIRISIQNIPNTKYSGTSITSKTVKKNKIKNLDKSKKMPFPCENFDYSKEKLELEIDNLNVLCSDYIII